MYFEDNIIFIPKHVIVTTKRPLNEKGLKTCPQGYQTSFKQQIVVESKHFKCPSCVLNKSLYTISKDLK